METQLWLSALSWFWHRTRRRAQASRWDPRPLLQTGTRVELIPASLGCALSCAKPPQDRISPRAALTYRSYQESPVAESSSANPLIMGYSKGTEAESLLALCCLFWFCAAAGSGCKSLQPLTFWPSELAGQPQAAPLHEETWRYLYSWRQQ